MAGLNRTVLVGRIVRDPELKRTTSGTSVTSFTVAIDNPTKAGGDKTTSFIPCTCWSKTAENVAKYCPKGTLVGIDGRINQRSYEDKSGAKHSIVEIIAENVQFLEKKNASGEGDDFPLPSDEEVSHEGIDTSDDELPF